MKDRIAMIVATWFYSSMIFKPAPGTFGTIFSLPLCFFVLCICKKLSSLFGFFLYSAVIMFIFAVGYWAVPIAEKVLQSRQDGYGNKVDRDQGQIVIDETFGIAISCFPLLYFGILNIYLGLLLAFIFFRIFDIIKFFPAKYFDNMESALGVMMDDFVAGAQTAVI